MTENDNSERAGAQGSTSDLQQCCEGGSCCPSDSDGGAGNWKIVVFILVVIAAGVVLAHSLINKSDSIFDKGQEAFAAIQAESSGPESPTVTPQVPAESEIAADAPSVLNDNTKEKAADKPAPTLSFQPLDSLASLNRVAANFDAVFILLADEDQLNMQSITREVEGAAKKIQADGPRVSAFKLKKDSPNYIQLAKQFSSPCVLAMVKGRGASGVSGEITETRLIQAYVTASRAGSGCCPGGGGACTPQPGPMRSK